MLDLLYEYNTRLVLIGTMLLGASAGVVGTFAVLRRRALTGDALGHAALPGVCLAVLVLRERSFPAMLLGAFLTGTLGVLIISFLRRRTRIKDDAAIGIVLSVFFAAGVVLLQIAQNQLKSKTAGMSSFIFGNTAGMNSQDLNWIMALTVAAFVVVVLLYKEFKLVAFDSQFAHVQGWPPLRLDFLLMLLVAVTVVVGLPAVGGLMIAALLILPGATARFWSDRLGVVLILAAFFGAVSGVVGTIISRLVDRMPSGPTIIMVGSILFFASMVLAPKRGVLARWRQQRSWRSESANPQAGGVLP